MKIHLSGPFGLALMGLLFLADGLRAEEYVVKSWVVGGTEAQSRLADQAMIGMQHWYADQFGGRTFKFEPTKVYDPSAPGAPRYSGPKKIGTPRKGELHVFWDNNWVSTTRPEGYGGGGNYQDMGGEAVYSVRGVLDPIINNKHVDAPGYGGAGRAWYVATHEFGHALGLGHVGGGTEYMAYSKNPTEVHPYDEGENQRIFGPTAEKQLANNRFLSTANAPGATPPVSPPPPTSSQPNPTNPTPPPPPPPSPTSRKPGQGGKDVTLMTGKERLNALRGGDGPAVSTPTPPPAPKPGPSQSAPTTQTPSKGACPFCRRPTSGGPCARCAMTRGRQSENLSKGNFQDKGKVSPSTTKSR